MTSLSKPEREGRGNQERSQRKLRDRSLVLAIVGTVLLIPPVADIFLINGKLFGLPIPLLYVFIVWIGLIVAAARLARPLRDGDDPGPVAEVAESER